MGFEIDTSEFEAKLRKLEDPGRIAKMMLREAAPTLQAELSGAAPTATGAMAGSIAPGPVLKRGDGHFCAVRPTGVDGDGVRNMDKAGYTNYGTPQRPGSHWIERGVGAAKGEVLAKYQEVFDREVGE